MNQQAVESARTLLESLGLDLTDKNYEKTPERFVKFLEEFTCGIRSEHKEELEEVLSVHFPKHSDLHSYYKGMVVQAPIRVYSICSHHLLPVIYDISVAYIPKEGKQLGFSKIARALRMIAHRPMNQEDFTQYVIELLNKKLDPEGLALIVRGTHMCMAMRGAKIDTNNITSAVRGSLKEESTKMEFMKLAQHYDRDRI